MDKMEFADFQKKPLIEHARSSEDFAVLKNELLRKINAQLSAVKLSFEQPNLGFIERDMEETFLKMFPTAPPAARRVYPYFFSWNHNPVEVVSETTGMKLPGELKGFAAVVWAVDFKLPTDQHRDEYTGFEDQDFQDILDVINADTDASELYQNVSKLLVACKAAEDFRFTADKLSLEQWPHGDLYAFIYGTDEDRKSFGKLSAEQQKEALVLITAYCARNFKTQPRDHEGLNFDPHYAEGTFIKAFERFLPFVKESGFSPDDLARAAVLADCQDYKRPYWIQRTPGDNASPLEERIAALDSFMRAARSKNFELLNWISKGKHRDARYQRALLSSWSYLKPELEESASQGFVGFPEVKPRDEAGQFKYAYQLLAENASAEELAEALKGVQPWIPRLLRWTGSGNVSERLTAAEDHLSKQL